MKKTKKSLTEIVAEKANENRIQESTDNIVGGSVVTTASLNGPSGEIDPDSSNANVVPTGTEVSAEKNKASIAAKPSKAAASGIPDKSFFTIKTEEIRNLFGEDLSEDFILKAATLFESSVNEKIKSIVADLEEQYENAIVEFSNSLTEELADSLNEYLQYVAEQFMEENKVAIDSGIRTELAESFIIGLKKLFDETYVEIPDSKINVLEELIAANKELQEEINQLLEVNSELRAKLTDIEFVNIFNEETVGLAQSTRNRLMDLAENVSANTPTEFRAKLRILKENLVTPARMLVENNDCDGVDDGTLISESEENGIASKYAKLIG